MTTWITTGRGNLVSLDHCISVFVEHVGGEQPWALRADVVAGPANPVLGLGRYADEAAARAALEAVRSRVAGLTSAHLDLRADPSTW